MKIDFNPSPNQRQKDRLTELMANARQSLNMKNLLPPISPDLPNTIDKIPDISEPSKSSGDIDREKYEAKIKLQKEMSEEFERVRTEKQAEYDAELARIEASKPKMEWNEDQQAAIDRGIAGDSFCLIGKAGTGKTTCTREIIAATLRGGKIGPITNSTKYLRSGSPGACIVSFTNRAVKNIARGVSGDMKSNCFTIHKLLEFTPTKMTITDAKGEAKETMRFLPKRNAANPLPSSLKLIIFEESSMISTELYGQLMDAIAHEIQMIFLGDLQQLPPVYGQAILGFKLLELPVIELKKIYRQAEGSPIINLAWRIASGDEIGDSKNAEKSRLEMEKISNESGGKIVMRPWKKRLDSFDALHITNMLFKKFIDAELYDPNEDMVMIPFNKSFGTLDFNLNLAQYLGRKRNARVHQVIAGFNKFYFAIGDKVLVDRQEALIEEIVINDMYKGVTPMESSEMLNRWGFYEKADAPESNAETHETSMEEVEAFLLQQSAKDDEQNDEAKQQGSHILICRLLDSDEIVEVRTTGEYSSCLFAYALTVHKCQGSEWRKCFLLLHNSHAVMLNRELLYTAVTRAREELYIICEPDAFAKGVRTQRIKGNTIAEKAEYFKGKLEKEM